MHSSFEAFAKVGRIDVLLDAIDASSSVSQRRWLKSLVERGVRVVDPGSLTTLALERLRALRVDADSLSGAEIPPRSVVIPFVGERAGYARRFVVRRAGAFAHTMARRSFETEISLRRSFELAAKDEGISEAEVDELHFDAWLAFADAHVFVEGRSIALGAYLAGRSEWSSRAFLPGVAATGAIEGARIVSVGGLRAKVEALVHRADVARLLVAPGNFDEANAAKAACGAQFEILAVATTEEAAAAALSTSHEVEEDLDQLVSSARSLFDRAWGAYRWPIVEERLARLAASTHARPDLHAEVLAMWGGAARHLGAVVESERVLGLAVEFAKAHEREVPDAVLARLYGHAALTAVQDSREKPALTNAKKALRFAERSKQPRARVKALGTLGLVSAAAGLVDDAIAAQEEASARVHAAGMSDCTRGHAYVLDALAVSPRASRLGERIDREFEEARVHLSRRNASSQHTDEPWLRVAYAHALVRTKRFGRAIEVLSGTAVAERIERDALPGLSARRWLGLACTEVESKREEGFRLLADSVFAYGLADTSRLAVVATHNALFEVLGRAKHGQRGIDNAAKARWLVGRVAEHESVRGELRELARDVHSELANAVSLTRAARSSLERLSEALSRLGY